MAVSTSPFGPVITTDFPSAEVLNDQPSLEDSTTLPVSSVMPLVTTPNESVKVLSPSLVTTSLDPSA